MSGPSIETYKYMYLYIQEELTILGNAVAPVVLHTRRISNFESSLEIIVK